MPGEQVTQRSAVPPVNIDKCAYRHVHEGTILESRMPGNRHVRFGEGVSEKGENAYLAGILLYIKRETLDRVLGDSGQSAVS